MSVLRGLPTPKKYAVVLMLLVTLLQGVGIVSIVAGLLVDGPDSFVRNAPGILLCVMVGVVVQVTGMVYVLVPSGTGARGGLGAKAAGSLGGSSADLAAAAMMRSYSSTLPATLAASELGSASQSTGMGLTTPHQRSMLTHANVAAQEMLAGSSGPAGAGTVTYNTETYSMLSGGCTCGEVGCGRTALVDHLLVSGATVTVAERGKGKVQRAVGQRELPTRPLGMQGRMRSALCTDAVFQLGSRCSALAYKMFSSWLLRASYEGPVYYNACALASYERALTGACAPGRPRYSVLA